MTVKPKGFAEIDSCSTLFLREIGEPQQNSLRLLIEEAFVLPGEVTVRVGGTEITGGRPIESTVNSRLFKVVWDSYVAYSVRNESYVTRAESEEFSGRLIRVYSKSNFLDYVSHSTFACREHPGPLQHTGLVCECHVIDVVSTMPPEISQIRSKLAVQ
jgi:hypothetical protein